MLRAIRQRLSGRSGAEVVALLFKNVAHSVRRFGPSAVTARRRDGAFDRRWGTDTSRLANLSSLQVDPARARHGVRYQPSNADWLTHAIDALALDPTNYALVDYGCGKGRICLVAAAMRFRRVVGVEFSPELCRIAERNAACFVQAGGASRPPEIVLGDAGAFEPPAGQLLAYFYNPFGSPVLDEVVARLEVKAAVGEDVVVCYVDPQGLATFTARDRWEVVHHEPELALLRSRTPPQRS